MADLEVSAAATQFMIESDQQSDMWDVYVRYTGTLPADRAFKIIDGNNSKIVNKDGLIVPISTVDLLGGVMYGLVEQGTISSEEWPTSRVIHQAMAIAHILGERSEHDLMLRSAARATIQTAVGLVIPGDWVSHQSQRIIL